MTINPRLKHRLRWIGQLIRPPSTAVIGGYHYGNLGDMALGASVMEQLGKAGRRDAGLQTIYNLASWPKVPRAILGGGAVGYSGPMAGVLSRYASTPGCVGVLGVDFNEREYRHEVLEFLRHASWVSCRSRSQADRLVSMTGREDIHDHPDIAFALHGEFCASHRHRRILGESRSPRILAVNAVPIYGEMRKGRLVTGEAFREERPEIYAAFPTVHRRYQRFLAEAVDHYRLKGWQAVSVAFSPSDEAYARMVFGDSIRHRPYDPDPGTMLRFLAGCGTLVATRFHATIFGIKLGLPMLPFAYATKNERLLARAGVPPASFVTPDHLLSEKAVPLSDPLTLGHELAGSLEKEAADAINRCIASLDASQP
jgi:hypothetical protein